MLNVWTVKCLGLSRFRAIQQRKCLGLGLGQPKIVYVRSLFARTARL